MSCLSLMLLKSFIYTLAHLHHQAQNRSSYDQFRLSLDVLTNRYPNM